MTRRNTLRRSWLLAFFLLLAVTLTVQGSDTADSATADDNDDSSIDLPNVSAPPPPSAPRTRTPTASNDPTPQSSPLPVHPGAATHSLITAALRATGFQPGLNQGLTFDGVNDSVDLGPAPELNSATFTLELWFKWNGAGRSATTGEGGIVAYPLISKGPDEGEGSDLDANYFLGIQYPEFVLAADFEEHVTGSNPGANHPVVGRTPIAPGVWHHAAVSYDGTCWELYLNGQPETGGSNCPAELPNFDSLQRLALGAALDSDGGRRGHFDGTLDELRIWNRALDEEEIPANLYRRIPLSNEGLVGWFAFDELSETVENGVDGSAGGTIDGAERTVDGVPLPDTPEEEDQGDEGALQGFDMEPKLDEPLQPDTPPDQPTGVTPTSGATGVSPNPTLCVTVNDVDTDPMSVTFFGRLQGAPTFAQIDGIQTGLGNLETACVSWPGRQDGSTYEWYVEIDDPTESTTSATFNFSSDLSCGVAGDCDDANACTDDACNTGTCGYTNNSGPCDTSACLLNQTCSAGVCGGGVAPSGAYTETFEVIPTTAGSWLTLDLSVAPFSVPANAVVELVARNDNNGNARYGGVRAFGSSLDRRFLLHKAEGGGVDAVVMHVQTDASSRIEYWADLNIDFVLMGYWTGGTYVERFDTFTAGADVSWEDQDLSSFGLVPGSVAEIVIANSSQLNEREAGVRTNGSSLARIVDIHEAEIGLGSLDGLDVVTMFVKADATVNATVELYAELDAEVAFYLVGYWSLAPLSYTELSADLGGPAADDIWEDLDLTGFGVPDDAVAEIAMENFHHLTGNEFGVRANGSTLDLRFIALHEAQDNVDPPNGGSDFYRAHALSDATATIEFRHGDVSDPHQFNLVGYWDDSACANNAPDQPTGVTPPDQATGVDANPQLCVDVTDPDGDSMDVEFWGAEQAQTFLQIGSTQSAVASGGTACVTAWPGRQNGVVYEWEVRISDASATTTSSTFSFASGGGCSVAADCDDGNICTTDTCPAGTCQYTNNTVECRADAGECDVAEFCDGAGACPADGFETSGTNCGDTGTECTNQDLCDGAGACTDNGFATSGSACGDTGVECLVDDTCDGAGTCDDNGFATSGSACGDTGVECLVDDTCDGAGTCDDNGFATSGTNCGDTGTECTNQDLCDGAGACTDNGFATSGSACGDTGVECLVDDTCDGAGTCDDNGFATSGSACGDTGVECLVDDTCDGAGTCDDNGFATSGTNCGDTGTECTNQDLCDGAGACTDNGFATSGSACGDTGVECLVDDTCDGAGTCDDNGFATSGSACGDTGVECLVDDTCDGAGTCDDNGFATSGTNCGDTGTECTNQDLCDGAGACTDNGFATSGSACGDTGVECLVDDTCDGAGTCDDNGFATSGSACGDTGVECLVDDTCDGAGTCDDNGFATSGTNCGDTGTECTNQDLCDGAGACTDNGFATSGSACGDTGVECLVDDTCDGAGTCDDNGFATSGSACGDTGVECLVDDTCDGAGTCDDNGFATSGTNCGDTGTECTNQDLCDGAGACTDNGFATSGSACGDTGVECLVDDTCDGAGTCDDNGFATSGSACGDTGVECLVDDTCDGAGTCDDNGFATSGTNCGDTGTECTNQDLCDGAGACTDNGFATSGSACGDTGVECLVDDTCDGAGTCDDNGFATSGSACGDTGVECLVDDTCDGAGTCDDNGFATSGTNCGDTGTECTNQDLCDGAGACTDNGFATSGSACGDTGVECLVDDTCDGAGTCDDNGFATSGSACGDTGVECLVDDTCDGAGTCDDNGFATSGTNCGDTGTECTNQDLCDGAGACTDNGFATSGSACGDTGVECLVDDTCDGAGTCDDNGFATSGTNCGDTGTECTNQDLCDGAGACTDNGFATSGSACGDTGVECLVDDTCDGAGTCDDNGFETDNSACDDGAFCTSGEICTAGLCGGGGDTCDDSITCTTDTCNEGPDTCSYTPSGTCGVTGTVYYYRTLGAEPTTNPVKDVDINLSPGLTIDGTIDAVTDTNGEYSLPSQSETINISTSVKFGATGTEDENGAISALDAAAIAQQAASIVAPPHTPMSANQLKAADASGLQGVSAFDAALVAQHAAGLPGHEHLEVAVATGSDWLFWRCDNYVDAGNQNCINPVYVHDPIAQSEIDDFYAILYGEVTGNWLPSTSANAAPGEGDRPSATSGGVGGIGGFYVEDTPEQLSGLKGVTMVPFSGLELREVTRDPSLPVAGLATTVRPGTTPGRYTVVFHVSNADGILGLDLDLGYSAGRISIVGVETLEVADQFSTAVNDMDGHLRIVMFSPVAMEGSGRMLAIEVESLTGERPVAPFVIEAQANEGAIRLNTRAIERSEPRNRNLGPASDGSDARRGSDR